MHFSKLFSSILDSTVWQEPPPTKIVWITMLAMQDRDGLVHTSIPGLAKRAGVTIPECESALECFRSPDAYSRTKDYEGRRIFDIDGGFRLVNAEKYRKLLSTEERREYMRLKQANRRAKMREVSKNCQQSSTNVNTVNTIVEVDVEVDATKRINSTRPCARPSVAEIKGYAASAPVPITQECAEAFHDTNEAVGWITRHGQPIADWRASLRRYASNWNANESKQPAKDWRKEKSKRECPEPPRDMSMFGIVD